MNYKEIYKRLKDAGAIDKILAKTNNDRKGVVFGIRYLDYFINSNDFYRLTYWKSQYANPTVCKVCVEFAKLQIAAYKYMAAKMK